MIKAINDNRLLLSLSVISQEQLRQIPQKLLFPHRIQIMRLLMSTENVKFKDMRERTGLSDGYLWSHIRALECDGLLVIKKELNGRKVKTTYDATDKGSEIFNAFRQTMLKLLSDDS
jgi:DNA-binding HxlR family transcriptional regulator